MEKNFNCPFCVCRGRTPDTKKHLYVNEEKGVYYCQRCNMTGVIDEQFKYFQSLMPIYNKPQGNKFDNIELVKVYDAQKFNNNAMDVYGYCFNRLPRDIVIENIWWSPDIPRRAFFVIHEDNKPVMWQGRTIDLEVKPKYLTWGKCSKYVYGYENCMEEWGVLCEGPFSALSCPNGMCIFGKRISLTQGMLLATKFNTLYLAVEKGAEEEWERIENDLTPFVECVKLNLGAKDANDIGYEGMQKILQEQG